MFIVKEPMYKVYDRAIARFAINNEFKTEIEDYSKEEIKKLIYLDVKYIGAIKKSGDEVSFYKKTPFERFHILDAVLKLIGTLKPMELVEMFPVIKVYDGEKYQTKDYYFTMEAINKLDPDEPIGDKAFDLLWDYMNWDLTHFTLELIDTMSTVELYKGKRDITDFLFNELLNDDEPKKQIKKPKLPEYIKLIK